MKNLFSQLKSFGGMKQKMKFAGYFIMECYDKHGKLKWSDTLKNGATNVGLNHLLDIVFYTTAKPDWYVGLIRDDNFSSLSASDTMSSHSGWEEADEYDEADRQEITFDAASGQEIANSTRCYFSINDTETIKGAFLCTDDEKGGTAGVLFCTALNDGGDKAVVDGDVIKVIYTITAAAA